jgi:hypothetical protein
MFWPMKKMAELVDGPTQHMRWQGLGVLYVRHSAVAVTRTSPAAWKR